MFTIPAQNDIILSLPSGHSAANHQGRKELLSLARQAAQKSYSPYSSFPVGAAVQTWGGKIYLGHNTETASSEGLNCGERAAVLNAVTHGEHFLRHDFLQVVALSCVKAPSPYGMPLHTRNGELIEHAVDLAVEEQDDDAPQINFAGLTPGWLSNQFVMAALADGSPCGACRQVMNDFSGKDTIILIDDMKDGVLFRMSDLLPVGFRFGNPDADKKMSILDLEYFEGQLSIAKADLNDASSRIAQNSYAWGNGFLKNGTAIRCKDGRVYLGAAMINSSTGLSMNSPRAAINRAILDGAIERSGTQFIDEIVTTFPDQSDKRILPRGFSSDLMLEFLTDDCRIAVQSAANNAEFRKNDFMNLFCPS